MEKLRELRKQQHQLYQAQLNAISEYLNQYGSLFLIEEEKWDELEDTDEFLENALWVWLVADFWDGGQFIKCIGIKRTIDDGKIFDEVYYIPECGGIHSTSLYEISDSSLGALIEFIIENHYENSGS